MKKHSSSQLRFCCLLFTIALLLPVATAGQTTPAAIEGRWDIKLSEGGDTPVGVEFMVKDGKLSGIFHAVSGPTALDSVALEGTRLTFSWTWNGPGGDVQMLYIATVKDGRMEGTWDLGDAASQSFTATRRSKS
jgi:hypothetical protein